MARIDRRDADLVGFLRKGNLGGAASVVRELQNDLTAKAIAGGVGQERPEVSLETVQGVLRANWDILDGRQVGVPSLADCVAYSDPPQPGELLEVDSRRTATPPWIVVAIVRLVDRLGEMTERPRPYAGIDVPRRKVLRAATNSTVPAIVRPRRDGRVPRRRIVLYGDHQLSYEDESHDPLLFETFGQLAMGCEVKKPHEKLKDYMGPGAWGWQNGFYEPPPEETSAAFYPCTRGPTITTKKGPVYHTTYRTDDKIIHRTTRRLSPAMADYLKKLYEPPHIITPEDCEPREPIKVKDDLVNCLKPVLWRRDEVVSLDADRNIGWNLGKIAFEEVNLYFAIDVPNSPQKACIVEHLLDKAKGGNMEEEIGKLAATVRDKLKYGTVNSLRKWLQPGELDVAGQWKDHGYLTTWTPGVRFLPRSTLEMP